MVIDRGRQNTDPTRHGAGASGCGGIRDAADEEHQAGLVVADEEQERVIGGEVDRLGGHAARARHHDGGGGAAPGVFARQMSANPTQLAVYGRVDGMCLAGFRERQGVFDRTGRGTTMMRIPSRVLGFALVASAASALFWGCAGGTPPPTEPAGASGPAPASQPAGAPAIPHDIAGREDCTSCHKVGAGSMPLPASHQGRDNSSCRQCHQPKSG